MRTLRNVMKHLLPITLLAMFTIMAGCTGDTNTNATPTATDFIAGTVRDVVTGAPLANVTVKNGVASAVTDVNGLFNLGGFPVPIGANDGTPAYAVAITNLPAGYPTVAYRAVTVASGGANNLFVGLANATVTGIILNNNGTPAVGAKVFLSYDTAAAGVAGPDFTAVSALSATTSATGTYTFTGVEVGSRIHIAAEDSTGMFSIATNPDPTVSLVNGSTLIVAPLSFNLDPDGFTVLHPTISVGGAAPTTSFTNVGSGSTVIEYVLNTPIAQTNFTAAPNAANTAFVGIGAVKVPFTITYKLNASTQITAIDVTFTTGASSLYTVNLGDPTGASLNVVVLGSFLNNIGVAVGAPAGKVIFSTDSGTVPAAIPLLSRPLATVSPAPSNDLTFSWQPISGASGFNVYAQRIEGGVTFPLVLVTSLPDTQTTYTLIPTAVGGPFSSAQFAFADFINPVTFSVQVHPVGSDLAENPALNSTSLSLTDRYLPFVTLTTARPTVVAVGGIAVNGTLTGTTTFTFSEQMSPTSVQTAANFIATGLPALPAGATFTPVITYNPSPNPTVALPTATMAWTLTAGATAIPAGTVVNFTGLFTDLAGNPINPATIF